jgi:hypothetical protein
MAAKKKSTSLRRKPNGWIIVERRDALEWPRLYGDFATRPEAEKASKGLAPHHGGRILVIPKSKSYRNLPPANKRRLRRDVRRDRH